MQSKTSSEYISNRAWLRDIIGGENLILRGVSALEYLEMFVGYVGEKDIEVYALKKGKYDNIDYCIVDSFDSIDFIRYGNTMCTSLNQTINDMLKSYEDTDELALTEALSNYYYANDESFDGLVITPENEEHFEALKLSAVGYYCGG